MTEQAVERCKKENRQERLKSEPDNSRAGFIYFARAMNGNIKIGFSQNPKNRVKELQTANSQDLQLLATLEGTQREEEKLHYRFRYFNICGEWFKPRRELIEFIGKISVKSNNSPLIA